MEEKKEIVCAEIKTKGSRFSFLQEDQEIARATVYFLKNDLHEEKFGFIEDVFVREDFRGKKLGTKLIKKIIEYAKQEKCYKLIATSRLERESVHMLYKKLGFEERGKEFRMDFF
jgi:GNAT superfamily N-acetyltransferase